MQHDGISFKAYPNSSIFFPPKRYLKRIINTALSHFMENNLNTIPYYRDESDITPTTSDSWCIYDMNGMGKTYMHNQLFKSSNESSSYYFTGVRLFIGKGDELLDAAVNYLTARAHGNADVMMNEMQEGKSAFLHFLSATSNAEFTSEDGLSTALLIIRKPMWWITLPMIVRKFGSNRLKDCDEHCSETMCDNPKSFWQNLRKANLKVGACFLLQVPFDKGVFVRVRILYQVEPPKQIISTVIDGTEVSAADGSHINEETFRAEQVIGDYSKNSSDKARYGHVILEVESATEKDLCVEENSQVRELVQDIRILSAVAQQLKDAMELAEHRRRQQLLLLTQNQ